MFTDADCDGRRASGQTCRNHDDKLRRGGCDDRRLNGSEEYDVAGGGRTEVCARDGHLCSDCTAGGIERIDPRFRNPTAGRTREHFQFVTAGDRLANVRRSHHQSAGAGESVNRADHHAIGAGIWRRVASERRRGQQHIQQGRVLSTSWRVVVRGDQEIFRVIKLDHHVKVSGAIYAIDDNVDCRAGGCLEKKGIPLTRRGNCAGLLCRGLLLAGTAHDQFDWVIVAAGFQTREEGARRLVVRLFIIAFD